jgi:hypothetical protein
MSVYVWDVRTGQLFRKSLSTTVLDVKFDVRKVVR